MNWCALVLLFIFVIAFGAVDGSPYNKYGRTCRDILCIAGQEECVMESDACTSYTQKCGSYPTCKRKATATKRGCASIKCETGQFCSIRQENCSRPPCEIKPVCISFRKPSSSSVAQSSASSQYSGVNRNYWTWNSQG